MKDCFDQGPILEIRGDDIYRSLNEELLDRFSGLKVEIFANEYPPPHFRVKYQGATANFDIRNCSTLNGDRKVLRYQKNIEKWWLKNKAQLVKVWNDTRPDNCPVGKYRE